jgi:hypothetical protein
MSVADADLAAVTRQLGRAPRAIIAVAHRCPCGLPDVIESAPRLPDGTPFPTLYYLTCVRACKEASRLESAGMMRELTARLTDDAGFRAAYQQAHRDYSRDRDAAAKVAGVPSLPRAAPSAGGMPGRVKCLHALAAHELAAPGTNPVGREAIAAMGQWWLGGPCVETGSSDDD